VLEALTRFAHDHEPAAVARARGTAFLLGALEKFGPCCGTPDGVPVPGLLTGLGVVAIGTAPAHTSTTLVSPHNV
jgi:hypothetical protein